MQNRRPCGRLFVFSSIALRQLIPTGNAPGKAPTPSAMVTMMMVVAMMPMMAVMPVMPMVPVMMMAMMPSRLGDLHLGTLLNRRGGAGIGQRQRLGLFGWGGEHQQSAN